MSAATRTDALQLFLLRDGDLVASELFGEGIYLLGGAGSDVLLDQAEEPVQLEFLEGRVRLESSAGFQLNGVRVAEALLSSADDVWLGPYLLKTRIMGTHDARSVKPKPGRAANTALALVPEPPRPSPPEFELHEVEQLLATPLIELDANESADLLTPIMDLVTEVNEWGETNVQVDGELTFAFLEWPLQIEDAEDLSLPEPEILDTEEEEKEKEKEEKEKVSDDFQSLSAFRDDPNPFASSLALEPVQPLEADAPVASGSRNTLPSAAGSLALHTDALVLHARIFWDETLLFSSSSSPQANRFGAPADEKALQLYGFGDQHTPLVRATASGFQLQLPEGAQPLQRGIDGWQAAISSASREMQLPLGAVVRVARDRLVLELSAQTAPQRAAGDGRGSFDLRLLALLVILGVSAVIFIKLLPKVIPQPAIAPGVMRQIQMRVAKKAAHPLVKKTKKVEPKS
jgi:hypothetical protein